MYLRVSYKKKLRKKFASFKSLKKRVGSGVGSGPGSGSISQRYGSADSDPHQHVTDPQHCSEPFRYLFFQGFIYSSHSSKRKLWQVTTRENGCNFTFDFSQVYWNPRLWEVFQLSKLMRKNIFHPYDHVYGTLTLIPAFCLTEV
jgi:hypothetical protein